MSTFFPFFPPFPSRLIPSLYLLSFFCLATLLSLIPSTVGLPCIFHLCPSSNFSTTQLIFSLLPRWPPELSTSSRRPILLGAGIMAAYPISIPGASSRHDVMSPNSMASPISISSPYSVHSSLSNNSLTGQTLASSFATSVNSSTSTHASALSPQSEDESSGGLNSATLVDKKHKPHECDVCGACFARKVHLQRHSLRHQVCKPYCCERCGKVSFHSRVEAVSSSPLSNKSLLTLLLSTTVL